GHGCQLALTERPSAALGGASRRLWRSAVLSSGLASDMRSSTSSARTRAARPPQCGNRGEEMHFFGRSRDPDTSGHQVGAGVAGGSRRARAVLALGGLLAAGPAPARAGGLLEEPCFATCGQYKWFLAHDADVRDNGQCCVALIRQAKQNEERALELYEQARQP